MFQVTEWNKPWYKKERKCVIVHFWIIIQVNMKLNILEEINEEYEKRLAIAFPPPITSYLPFSAVSSIITAQEKSLNWIYNNFIQIYHKGIGKVDYYPNSDFAYNDKVILNTNELTQNNYRLAQNTIIDDIKFWIDNNNYVIFYLAESHVPGMRFYKRADVVHSEFIFGYNDEKKCVYVMNFPSNGQKLAIIELGYEDLKKALCYTIEYNKNHMQNKCITMKNYNKEFRIILLRYNQVFQMGYSSEINVKVIKKQISDFVNCNNSSIGNSYFTLYQNGKWGLDAYEQVYRDFLSQVENNKNLDFRFMCMLYEHKCIMKDRMQILNQIYGIVSPDCEMDEIIKITEQFKNTVLKYNITHNKKLIDRFEIMFDDLKKIETEVYSKYLENFEEY